MAAKVQPVRGTHDILPEEAAKRRKLVETAFGIAARYGYGEIATPIFEFTEVFARSLGDTSDVVTKEMYSFEDRGGESLTLRPEFTAGICRAFISNGMQQNLPCRFMAYGPLFRYERPQKGRMRQFHQIDAELIGIAKPEADAEVIVLAAHILEALGVKEKVTLELNTLGDMESRHAFRARLIEYLSKYEDELSEDSRKRLHKNPMRILDSKDEGDRKIVAGAPLMGDCLTKEAAGYFDRVCELLSLLGIAYRHVPLLVRGLDYYTHTAFEFTTTLLGAQNAVLAGGRYDALIRELGGPDTPGIGWASGVERLLELAEVTAEKMRPIAIVPIGDAAETEAFTLAEELRRAGLAVELGYGGNVGKRMKQADKAGARAAIMLGEDEMKAGKVTLRDLDSGEQEDVTRGTLHEYLNSRFKSVV